MGMETPRARSTGALARTSPGVLRRSLHVRQPAATPSPGAAAGRRAGRRRAPRRQPCGDLGEDVPADPGVHRHRGRGAGVDRAGRAELGDVEHRHARLARRRGQAGPLLAEEQDAAPRQVVGLQRHRPRQVVDADQRQAAVVPGGPLDQGRDRLVVVLVLVAVGDHRTAPVPAAAADDVEGLGVERVGGADDRADVEVVPQFSTATWKSCRRVSRSLTIASCRQ